MKYVFCFEILITEIKDMLIIILKNKYFIKIIGLDKLLLRRTKRFKFKLFSLNQHIFNFNIYRKNKNKQ